MHRYFSRNKDILNAFPHIAGIMTLDKNFDIKNFLNSFEEGFNNKPKKNNILNATSQYTNSKVYQRNNTRHNGYLTTFNNISTIKKNLKKTSGSFSTGLTKQNHLNTTNSIYMDYKHNNNKNTNYNFLSTINTSKPLHNRKNIFRKYKSNYSNENFNVYKTIKEIKESTLFPNITHIKKSPTKQLFITSSNESRKSPISYCKEHIDIVSDSIKVIDDFNFRRELNLNTPEKFLTFSSKRKEISFRNFLIDLLYNESKKISTKEKMLKTKNDEDKIAIDKNIKEFEDYADKIKQICKSIENCYDRLQKGNNALLKELMIYESIHKSYEDEIERNLEQIEKLRKYALFVHQSLGKDISRYVKIIAFNLSAFGLK